MHSQLMMLVRLVKFLTGLFLLANVFLWTWRPFRLFAVSVAHRSAGCPLGQVFRVITEDRLQNQAHDRVSASSRLIWENPADFHSWEAPNGSIWMPADGDWLIAFLHT